MKKPFTWRTLPKIKCEVCGNPDSTVLQKHHIIERTELNTNNDPFNCAILCGNCHILTHDGKKLKILGVFPSTDPSGRTLIYEKDGICNFPGITEAYFKPRAKKSSIF